MKTRHVKLLFVITFVIGVSILSLGCPQQHVPGSAVKVAKVDTEYIYEANISKFVGDFRSSRRTRISNFIGFTPDDILNAREHAVDNEIRREIKRLPGVNISSQVKRELASRQVEELAWEIYERLSEEPDAFGRLAREYSTGVNARTGGQLQGFGIVDNPEPYQERAYAMEIGEVTEPLSSWDGWRIVMLREIEDDPFIETSYHISMILLTPDIQRAEATMIDEVAAGHTIEILDPKYNARRAYQEGNFEEALERADEALSRNPEDDLAHYLRARALWELGDHDPALDAMQAAADTGRISDGLIPYYLFFKGQYLEFLDRNNEVLAAYHDSFEFWRQDINLAYSMEETFERLADDEYLELIRNEIEIIVKQDQIARGLEARGTGSTGVIVYDDSQTHGSSVEYEEGFRAKD